MDDIIGMPRGSWSSPLKGAESRNGQLVLFLVWTRLQESAFHHESSRMQEEDELSSAQAPMDAGTSGTQVGTKG